MTEEIEQADSLASYPGLEPLVRLLAILVQGIKNRRPTRRIAYTPPTDLQVMRWRSRGVAPFLITLADPKRGEKRFYFYPPTAEREGRWFKDTNLMPNMISQSEAEGLASIAATFPYSVDHVGDEAIAIAKRFVVESLANDLAHRKKAWGEE